MPRFIYFAILIFFVINGSFAWSFPNEVLLTDYIGKFQVSPVNYQSQEGEKNSKSDEHYPRIVSFDEQLAKIKKRTLVKIFKVFLTGFGDNIVFKTKVDKRIFKMFMRMTLYYDVTPQKYDRWNRSRFPTVREANSVDTFDHLARIYTVFLTEGYSRKTRGYITIFQKFLVRDLKAAEKKLKKAETDAERNSLRRKIRYLKGMLKELGRLIEHLDKQQR